MAPLTVMVRGLARRIELGVGLGAALGVLARGAATTTPDGAAAAGPLCPCSLARRLSATTIAVHTVITVVTPRRMGVVTT